MEEQELQDEQVSSEELNKSSLGKLKDVQIVE